MSDGHKFGGAWTEEKLSRLQKYLHAYMQIMKRQPFKVAYIDAFAGTGYTDSSRDDLNRPLFEVFAEEEPKEFLKGSAVRALEVDPPFHKYVFIERKLGHVAELEALKAAYPALASRIEIKRGDANHEVRALCAKQWSSRRAVLFLDPYGMQVEWATIEAIAKTRAIDLWILFPLGIAVNRLLTRSGKIDETWRRRLDLFFGTGDWFKRFYVTNREQDLFGEVETMKKEADLEDIGRYFIERLKTVFPAGGVADNPLPLSTPDGHPLFLLCFAAGNEKGAKTAVKIAQEILGR